MTDLAPRTVEPQPASGPVLRRILRLVVTEQRRFAFTLILAAVTAAAGIALLATSAWLISRAAQRPSVVALGTAVIGVRFFAICRALSRYCERLVGHDTALRSLGDLRVKVFERLEALAPAGIPAFRRGDLLERLVGDVDALQDLLLRVIPPYATVVLVGGATTFFVWYVLPAAGVVVAVAFFAAAVVVPRYTRRLAAVREARESATRGELSAHLVDLIEGAPELVAFGAAEAQLQRVAAADAELTRISAANSFTAGVGAGLVTLITGLAVWAVLLWAIPAVDDGRIQPTLLAVLALIPLAAYDMLVGLPAAAQSLERIRRSSSRVLEVIDAAPPVAEPPVPHQIPAGVHTLRARGLRCRYGPDRPWVLDGVDFDLTPGKRLGVIGPSGVGKSTLAAVLLRFLPYEGSVTLDGVELAYMAGDDVREVIGLDAQDTHLFDTTLRENLLLARRDASDEQLCWAMERVRLRDWVDELPLGLATPLGVHGAAMSGGQQQRLGIARTQLAGFPILVFDEPGEHLDTSTADAIVAELMELTEAQSTIMITHRLAGVETMDEILVLEEGRVAERGTHAELLALGGVFARRWALERRVEIGSQSERPARPERGTPS